MLSLDGCFVRSDHEQHKVVSSLGANHALGKRDSIDQDISRLLDKQ